MNVANFGSRPFGLLRGNGQHFMGDGFGEDNNHLRRAYLILEVGGALGEDLAFAAMGFAYLLIVAVHTVVTADYYYVH